MGKTADEIIAECVMKRWDIVGVNESSDLVTNHGTLNTFLSHCCCFLILMQCTYLLYYVISSSVIFPIPGTGEVELSDYGLKALNHDINQILSSQILFSVFCYSKKSDQHMCLLMALTLSFLKRKFKDNLKYH